jgi:excinuclease UvrABC nuclease subunit
MTTATSALLDVPIRPGIVYQHLDPDGVILYVGSTQTHQMRDRQASHARQARWWRYVAKIEQQTVRPDRRAAYLLEAEMIWAKRPVFNRTAASLADEQKEREARYVSEHAHLDLRATTTRDVRCSLSREARQKLTDVTLTDLGVTW